MAEQTALFDVPPKKKHTDPKKRAWENAFQRWSNKVFYETDGPYGACGFGAICDYCESNDRGRPCVRAINSMCRENYWTINYSDKSDDYFKKCFVGRI